MIEDTEALVRVDIRYRQQMGIRKYGTTVAKNDLTEDQWDQHLYEELLDAVIYLKRRQQLKQAALARRSDTV